MVKGVEEKLNLPTSITTGFAGTAQVFQESLKGQAVLILLALFVVYVVLGILYESYIHRSPFSRACPRRVLVRSSPCNISRWS